MKPVQAKEWIEIWLKVCTFAMPCAYRWIFVSAAFAGFTANEVIAELDAIAAQRAELDRVARGLAEWRPGLRRLVTRLEAAASAADEAGLKQRSLIALGQVAMWLD